MPPNLPARLAALLDPAAYPHPVDRVRLIETHISWLLIAGEYAYKIKKPVDLGFLDFSRPEQRAFYCSEEIRLNRRLAPEIYLDVVPLRAGPRGAALGGAGEIIEWAVRMRAFPSEATLDHAVRLRADQIDAIAARIAAFHADLPLLAEPNPFGSPETIHQPALDNFSQIAPLLPATDPPRLEQLQTWSEQEFKRLEAHFQARKRDGQIRECHGDLHLGNIAWVNDAPLIFDALEFSPALRHIDPISELAFLRMDLLARGEDALAWRLVDRYLGHRDDHAGLAGLRYYEVYRAMVRAKIAAIRRHQQGTPPAPQGDEFERYLALAERLATPARPALMLMHGFSGSGKSWLAERLAESLGAIRLRSDVERKRLFGLAPQARPDPRQSARLYSAEATRATFDHLVHLAGQRLADGYRVIVDATFLDRALRARFITLATRHGLTAQLIDVTAPVECLRQRLRQRQAQANDPSDADLAVLEHQLAHHDPPSPAEGARLHHYASESPTALAELLPRLAAAGTESGQDSLRQRHPG